MRTIFIAAAAALALPALTQTLNPNEVVLTVNGERITASEYYNRMEFLDGVGTLNAGRFVEAPPAFLTIQRLVSEKLIVQLAREKGVEPTAAEVDAEFARHKAENPERFQRFSDLGLSDAELKSQIAVELAQFNLVTMDVNVTDEQVTEHYNLNKPIYVRPATVKLRVIVVREAADRSRVDDALRTRSFADVARDMSTDITKFDGGNLPEVPISNLPQNVLNEALRTDAGKTTQWIESEERYLKYLIEDKQEMQQLPLDEKLRASIKRQLMIVQGQARNNVPAMIEDMRRRASVQIAAPGLQKLWDLSRTGSSPIPPPGN